MSTTIIGAAAKKDIRLIADGYMNAVDYKLSDRPFFIEKFPENHLYLGFIAKAYLMHASFTSGETRWTAVFHV